MPKLNDVKKISEAKQSLLIEAAAKETVVPKARYSFWSSPSVATDFNLVAIISGITDGVLDLATAFSSRAKHYIEQTNHPAAICLRTIYWTLPLLLPFFRPSTCKRLKNPGAQLATAVDQEAGEGEYAVRLSQLIDDAQHDRELQQILDEKPQVRKHFKAFQDFGIDSTKEHLERDRSNASSSIIPVIVFLTLRALSGITLLIAINTTADIDTKDELEKTSLSLSSAANIFWYALGYVVDLGYRRCYGSATASSKNNATPSPRPLTL